MRRSELTWRWTGQKWVGDSLRMCTCWPISVCRRSRARCLSQQINSRRTMGRMTITPTITVATTRWCSVINLELSTCSAENECKIYWFPPFIFTCWRVAPTLTIVLWTRWNIHRAVPVLNLTSWWWTGDWKGQSCESWRSKIDWEFWVFFCQIFIFIR